MKSRKIVVICVRTAMKRAWLTEKLGEENILPTFDDALLRAQELLKKPIKVSTVKN